jgi:radical SAM protein with 4Fe4S-binding SPASM domain
LKEGTTFSAKWNEFRVLAATLSALKILNYAKLVICFFLSKWLKRPFQWGKPFSVSIEPTTSCNLRCPECPSGLRSFTRPTGMLENGLFTKLLNQLGPELTYLTFYFQGEPFLNPKFLHMVSEAAKNKVYTSTSTNAHYLKDDVARKTVESGLHRIIISIDGTSQDTYENYRIGGQLDKVIEGTQNLVKWKKKLQSATPHIIFQFLVVGPNEHQIHEVYKLAKELGVDEVKLKTAQIYDFENGSDLIPRQDKYSRYKLNSKGKYEIKNPMLNQCWQMWNSCVFTWDGKVVPCCFDKNASHTLGESEGEDFEKIWFGKEYQAFRGAILKSRKEIDICRNCTEGMEIWA